MENSSHRGQAGSTQKTSAHGHVTAASAHSHISKVPASSPAFPPGSSEHASFSWWSLLLCRGPQWRPASHWKSTSPGPLSWQEPRLMKTSTTHPFTTHPGAPSPLQSAALLQTRSDWGKRVLWFPQGHWGVCGEVTCP